MRALTIAAVLAAAFLFVLTGAVSAQVPFIASFFDVYLSQQTSPNPCPGMMAIDYMWVALINANTYISGVEFMIAYPPQMMWLADIGIQPVTVGNTQAGMSMSWALPQNGYYPVKICQVKFMWMCDYCPAPNIPIVVMPHPYTGFLGYTDFPGYAAHNAVGLTSLICQTVPFEESTWGQVKALYGE